MASHGGYREPANPAAVSGPGALSQRTDSSQPAMNLGSQSYGDGVDLQSIQGGAPLPQAQSPAQQQLVQQLANQVTPMGAPSGQPNTPVTAGANAGPGPDANALGIPALNPAKQEADALAKSLGVFVRLADSDSATPAFKAYVRNLLIASAQK